MRYFSPNLYYSSYLDIELSLLKKKGFTNLFFDIDNTLVAHDQELPDATVVHYLEQLQLDGFKVYLISNNNESRVKRFAKILNVPHFWFSMKPLKRTYRKIIKEYNLNPKTIAVIGDQLLTDVLGANRMGLFVIYTQPLVKNDISFTKINRLFEKVIIKRLNNKGKLEKGVLYE